MSDNSNYVVTRSAKNLAVSVDFISSMLRLDHGYDQSYLANVIRHCTAKLEDSAGYALVHKTITVTHCNPTIVVPFAPIYKVLEVRKVCTKDSTSSRVDPAHYECRTHAYASYVRLLPEAFTHDEQVAMGLSVADGAKRYYKDSHLLFEVDYEAGKPSSKDAEDVVAEYVPEAFKSKLVELVRQYMLGQATANECYKGLGESAAKFTASRL
jgi:hypothetical protein